MSIEGGCQTAFFFSSNCDSVNSVKAITDEMNEISTTIDNNFKSTNQNSAIVSGSIEIEVGPNGEIDASKCGNVNIAINEKNKATVIVNANNNFTSQLQSALKSKLTNSIDQTQTDSAIALISKTKADKNISDIKNDLTNIVNNAVENGFAQTASNYASTDGNIKLKIDGKLILGGEDCNFFVTQDQRTQLYVTATNIANSISSSSLVQEVRNATKQTTDVGPLEGFFKSMHGVIGMVIAGAIVLAVIGAVGGIGLVIFKSGKKKKPEGGTPGVTLGGTPGVTLGGTLGGTLGRNPIGTLGISSQKTVSYPDLNPLSSNPDYSGYTKRI